MLRYCYKNQPTIIWWNLVRLAEDLAELFAVTPDVLDSKDFIENGISTESATEELVQRAEKVIESVGEEYKSVFLNEYKALMARRLGFVETRETDMDDIYSPLLDTLAECQVDFGHFFRRLSELPVLEVLDKGEESQIAVAEKFVPKEVLPSLPDAPQKILAWLKTYAARLEPGDELARMDRMKSVNPKFVPKNWVLEEIIKRVEKDGDREVLKKVLKLVQDPFADEWEGVEDAQRWCGDVPRLEVGIQCSCSS